MIDGLIKQTRTASQRDQNSGGGVIDLRSVKSSQSESSQSEYGDSVCEDVMRDYADENVSIDYEHLMSPSFVIHTVRIVSTFSRSVATVCFRHRTFAVFVLVCFLITSVFGALSFYGQGTVVRRTVSSLGEKALSQFTDAATAVAASDPAAATRSLQGARDSFMEAHEQVQSLGGVALGISSRVPGLSQLKAGSDLVDAGAHLAEAGVHLSAIAELFSGVSEKEVFALDQESQSVTDLIVRSEHELHTANSELLLASNLVAGIQVSDLPDSIQDSFSQLHTQLPPVSSFVATLDSATSLLLDVLGHQQSRTYLFLFQNSSERRGLGGFIGSIGVFRLTDGKVVSMDFQDVYYADGQLLERSPERRIPPRVLQSVAYEWGIRDAGYYPDGPTSLAKISSLYEESGGPTVDGIITMTPQVLEDLLDITGPVFLADRNITLDSTNIQVFLRETIEQSKNQQNLQTPIDSPKNIIGEVAPRILHQLFTGSTDSMLQVWSVLFRSLSDRQMLLYFHNPELQEQVIQQGWGGAVRQVPGDYLQVVVQNVGGSKTDAVVQQNISHSAHILADGTIQDTVTITRTHHATPSDPTWYNAVNKSSIEVYVPEGSVFVGATGVQPGIQEPSVVDFQDDRLMIDPLVNRMEAGQVREPETGTVISQGFRKTMFQNWMFLEPGETKVMSFTYDLPQRLSLSLSLLQSSDSYSLYWQKQAGSVNDSYAAEISIEPHWDIVWQYPENVVIQQKGFTRSLMTKSDTVQDEYISLVFEH